MVSSDGIILTPMGTLIFPYSRKDMILALHLRIPKVEFSI